MNMRKPCSLLEAKFLRSRVFTYRFECRDFRRLLRVIQRILHVIDRDPSRGTADLGDLRNTLISAVPRFEVENRSPIIREVLGEGASRACRRLGYIHSCRIHGGIKGILTILVGNYITCENLEPTPPTI
jgi:hypothetical protein